MDHAGFINHIIQNKIKRNISLWWDRLVDIWWKSGGYNTGGHLVEMLGRHIENVHNVLVLNHFTEN